MFKWRSQKQTDGRGSFVLFVLNFSSTIQDRTGSELRVIFVNGLNAGEAESREYNGNREKRRSTMAHCLGCQLFKHTTRTYYRPRIVLENEEE
jgi:hypothetical protein